MQVETSQPSAATPSAVPSAPATSTPAPSTTHVNENRTGQRDQFTADFNSAQDEIAARERDREAKLAAVESDGGDEAEPEGLDAPAQTTDTTQTAPVTAPAQAVAPEPPSYWSRERKEAFRYQPRHVQEAWLAEDPAPGSRWSAEAKEAFAKLPREAKEAYLTHFTEVERNVAQKLQANATERKLAEDIRAAVPQHLREYMTQKQLTEPQVFAHLLNLQQQSMQDPAGYLRQFVQNNKLNPAEIFGVEIPQAGAPLPPEVVRAHPDFQQLYQQHEALRREVEQERAARAEQEQARLAAEFDQIVQEKNGEGEPLYPYIRLLADPMARLFESDSELFSSMSTKEKFATAYRMALEQFPELMPLKRTAAPPPADVPVRDAHSEAEAKRAEALDRAITPKSRTPTPSPKANGKTGDPLDDALRAASRQLSLTR